MHKGVKDLLPHAGICEHWSSNHKDGCEITGTGWGMTEYIRSRAPLRIGIAGGGTDVDPYASEKGGCVFNTTINRYVNCVLTPMQGDEMVVETCGSNSRYKTSIRNGPLKLDGNMDFIKAVSNYFELDSGFRIKIQSDVPAGSGLGGSSTMMVAIVSVISEWLERRMSKEEVARLSYHLEREVLGLKGGKQDQYAAAYGGFNYLDFNNDGVRVVPADIDEHVIDELQCRSVLCYTKISRDSADIIESQVESFKTRANEDALDKSKILARELGRAVEEGDIDLAGKLLCKSWEYKKQFSDRITNKHIDRLYTTAMNAGAIGGKISGAGGGGFMYFVCKYDKKPEVSAALDRAGAEITDFMFEPGGVKTWRFERGDL